ncbi:hypothetical protein HHA02_19240 [Cobetia marina]|nr:hypothetical protein HHA02_19240 [Cobetia marina]
MPVARGEAAVACHLPVMLWGTPMAVKACTRAGMQAGGGSGVCILTLLVDRGTRRYNTRP